MAFEARAVDYEEKPEAVREKELLDNHAAEQEALAKAVEETKVAEETKEDHIEVVTDNSLTDENVLSYIKQKAGREINSLEELYAAREEAKQDELPEDVAVFLKYKKETGRGLDDFIKLNRNFDSENPDLILAEYYKSKNPELDAGDIEYKLSKYVSDEDLDSESEIKERAISKKIELAEAIKFLNAQKEQYKAPLESRAAEVPNELKQELEAFKHDKQASIDLEMENKKRQQTFADKTNALFTDTFEGFKVNLSDDKSIMYKPADASTLKKDQSDLNTFIGSFLDENNFLKDAEAFHKSISIAQNPEKFAKLCYEQGKADMLASMEKESKNIDLRGTPNNVRNVGGLTFRSVDSGEDRAGKFK